LPENIEQYSEFFFFAAGIGITPVYSLIKTLLYGHPDKEVVLVYSNTSSETSVFYNELMQLQGQFPGRFRVELLLSSSRDLTRARLSKWLLPALLKTHSSPNKTEHIFYTCGPFAYMRMVILSLEEAGYSQEQIKKEHFDTHRPAARLVPPDTKPHTVSIRTRKATASLALSYPATILQAAKSAGIDIPYSCETGRCGSCLMQCTGGEIWMSHNEILTEKEIAEGKILACVGHPIHGDASVELL
jgi:ring-1,2-phenylacetyl-CoA epoxidase subunit PaaE